MVAEKVGEQAHRLPLKVRVSKSFHSATSRDLKS